MVEESLTDRLAFGLERAGAATATTVQAATYAAARLLAEPAHGTVLTVPGRDTVLDGYEGIFAWDSASVLADDNADTIKITDVTTGRWRRLTLSAGGAAPTGAGYVVDAAHASLSAERVATTSTTVTVNTASSGLMKWDILSVPLATLANSGGAIGDILYWNGTAWTRLAASTSGYVLTAAGAGAAPAWAASTAVVDAEYIVSTSDASLSAERVATTTQTVAYDASTAGQAKWNLTSDWGALSWTTTGTATLGNAIISGLTASQYVVTNGSKQLTSQQGVPLADLGNAGGAIGDVAVWNGTNWVRYAAGTSGYVLTANGVGVAPTWQAASSGAPTGAQYLTLALDGTLSAERRLVVGTGLTGTDSGANNDFQIDITNTGVGAGAYAYPSTVTVNGQGQVTAISAGNDWTSIPFIVTTASGSLSAERVLSNGDMTTIYNDAGGTIQVDHNTSAVAAGTYTSINSITVDAYGHITAISGTGPS